MVTYKIFRNQTAKWKQKKKQWKSKIAHHKTIKTNTVKNPFKEIDFINKKNRQYIQEEFKNNA